MIKSMSLSEAYLRDRDFRERSKKEFQLTQKNVEKIRKIAIRHVSYPEFKEAYDYVDKLFPRVGVKQVMIYKVASKDLIKMGYAGVEGFFDSISKIVVLSGAHKTKPTRNKEYNVEAKVANDEVIVHELCHYCYFFEGNFSISTEMKEAFAYGWSIGYLRQKNYSDDYIIRYNFLPYLMNISFTQATKNILAQNKISNRKYNAHTKFQRKEFNKKYGRQIFVRAKEIAIEKGQKLIDVYSKKIEEGSDYTDIIEEKNDRFELLDL